MMEQKIKWSRRGGRITGLFPEAGLNVLWENPDCDPEAAWPNPGGDRVWLSPESELFFTVPEKGWSSYTVPAMVDPGAYTVEETPHGVIMKTSGTAEFFSSRRSFDFTIVQKIDALAACDEPLHDGIAFAGYRKQVSLLVSGVFPPDIRPAIWNLIQFAPGSILSVPGTNFKSYFGEPCPEIREDHLELPLPARGESFKIGMDSRHSSGRMFCVNFALPRPWFVMRAFRPASVCCDKPWGGGDACCQQLFSDNGGDGGFGELEHHSEPVPPTGGITDDTCFTLAFAGPLEKLEKLYRKLLQKGIGQ